MYNNNRRALFVCLKYNHLYFYWVNKGKNCYYANKWSFTVLSFHWCILGKWQHGTFWVKFHQIIPIWFSLRPQAVSIKFNFPSFWWRMCCAIAYQSVKISAHQCIWLPKSQWNNPFTSCHNWWFEESQHLGLGHDFVCAFESLLEVSLQPRAKMFPGERRIRSSRTSKPYEREETTCWATEIPAQACHGLVFH